jgi:hypothetical protein
MWRGFELGVDGGRRRGMEENRRGFGVREVMKVLALGFGVVVLVLMLSVLTGVGLGGRTRSLDINSGKELVVIDVIGIPVRSWVIESEFSKSAVRQGLVTRQADWQRFQVRVWPDNGARGLYEVRHAVSELFRFQRAVEGGRPTQAQIDAVVREVLPELSASREFTIDYGENGPVGVNGRRVVP